MFLTSSSIMDYKMFTSLSGPLPKRYQHLGS